MKNGDISNDLPKRILVISDVFITTEIKFKKRLKIFKVPEIDKKIRRDILSSLYLMTTKRGVTLELVSYTLDETGLDNVIDMLDNMGTNPFRYYTAYSSINKLVDELPYRPEVIGVLDTPDRLLRYGHWGLDQSIL
jgi:hypothetical protein